MGKPRIVFMGTPQFAVASLEACLELGEVVAVVCQPDKPKGRGQELAVGPVKALAVAKGLPVLQPVKVKGTNFDEELRAMNADVAVVTAYGKILPAQVLAAPRMGCVNVHASLLPRFRGAAPIQWAIASGDAETGVCLMKMDEGMDTGPVIDLAKCPIRRTDTSAGLHETLSTLGGEVLRRSLLPYLEGKLAPQAQPSVGVVMAPMIRKEDGVLDFRQPAVVLERRMRAFTPWPGASTVLKGALMKVHAAEVAAGTGQPGEVIATEGALEVACGVGSLRLMTLQLEGKKALPAVEFLRGTVVEVGSRLG